LRTLQRLNLRLLVEREHHGIAWGMHVEPDNVAHLVDELRIRRSLKERVRWGFRPNVRQIFPIIA